MGGEWVIWRTCCQAQFQLINLLKWIVFWIAGADHILAQPLKRCSASCIKLNETFEFSKKRQNILCWKGGGGRKVLFTLSPSYAQSPKHREKSLSYSFAVEMGHFDMVRCKYDSVCSACSEIHWNWFCGRKQTKNAEIRKGAFFGEGCFDRKEYISNTANKRCSRQVLHLRCSSWYSIKFYT